ncbi:IS5 family transposase [Streptomyces sp. ME02-7008A-1]|nr:IS5 family transposase [Streptomyces sp. ME02-7008A-1]MDX3307363.1 IS5 family transposase [Streptomyces sp. ME02-7008A]
MGVDRADDHDLEAGPGGAVGDRRSQVLRCDLREVVNAIFYQNRTGCQWRMFPHDLPAWSAVFYYFRLWREDGLDQRIQELLRCQVREKARRLEDPSLVIIDTQSVRAAAGVPRTTTGLDANKKVSGRKRGLAVDVLGLIIGVVVMAASAHDNAAGTALLDQAAERCGMRLEKVLVDQGFKEAVHRAGRVNITELLVDLHIQENAATARADELRNHMPTDEASVNVTRSRLGRLTRQGFLTQPGRGRYQKRTY